MRKNETPDLEVRSMKTILLVEDEPAQQVLYREELKEMGYEVQVAESGEQALQIARQMKPDLIILDIMMPGMDGLETMRELLSQHPKVPVIINTAYSHFKDHFMSWAAEEYLVKSSDVTELKNAVKRILEKKASPRPKS